MSENNISGGHILSLYVSLTKFMKNLHKGNGEDTYPCSAMSNKKNNIW